MLRRQQIDPVLQEASRSFAFAIRSNSYSVANSLILRTRFDKKRYQQEVLDVLIQAINGVTIEHREELCNIIINMSLPIREKDSSVFFFLKKLVEEHEKIDFKKTTAYQVFMTGLMYYTGHFQYEYFMSRKYLREMFPEVYPDAETYNTEDLFIPVLDVSFGYKARRQFNLSKVKILPKFTEKINKYTRNIQQCCDNNTINDLDVFTQETKQWYNKVLRLNRLCHTLQNESQILNEQKNLVIKSYLNPLVLDMDLNDFTKTYIYNTNRDFIESNTLNFCGKGIMAYIYGFLLDQNSKTKRERLNAYITRFINKLEQYDFTQNTDFKEVLANNIFTKLQNNTEIKSALINLSTAIQKSILNIYTKCYDLTNTKDKKDWPEDELNNLIRLEKSLSLDLAFFNYNILKDIYEDVDKEIIINTAENQPSMLIARSNFMKVSRILDDSLNE